MAYKTCENCGSRVFNHGCVNCDEMEYINMQGAYDSKEEVKLFTMPCVSDSVCDCNNQKPMGIGTRGVNTCGNCHRDIAN